MPHNESFFGYLNALVREARDALGGDADVHEPREYRFDIEFPDRRYAFQGYPEEHRIFVGQYLGDRGVVWFDELRFDAAVTHPPMQSEPSGLTPTWNSNDFMCAIFR